MVNVQTEDFNVDVIIDTLKQQTNNIGAVVTFTGLVREFGKNSNITSMTLEHYLGMTESVLNNIADKATKRWSLLGTHITHRVGNLKAGDNIVLVATASAHRKDAFEAAQFIMDFLKTDAPSWKKEHTDEGDYWVESKDTDMKAKDNW